MSTTGDDPAPRPPVQLLTFLVAGQEYGLDLRRVQEIEACEPRPRTTEPRGSIRGAINLRGTLVPIVDLHERFRLDPVAGRPPATVVVVRAGRGSDARLVGLAVDAISGVCAVREEEVEPAPDLGGLVDLGGIEGGANVGSRTIVVLDVDRLLASGGRCCGEQEPAAAPN